MTDSTEVRKLGSSEEEKDSGQAGMTNRKEKKTDYTNKSQQNLMRIVEYLATDVFKPTPVKEISNALSITYSKATWALHNLKDKGWAEQVGDCWRLAPRIVRIADSVRQNLGENLKRYLSEVS